MTVLRSAIDVRLAVATLLAALALSAALVGAVRAYALRARVIDTPNERSSHTVPTPRGGGLGAVGAFLTVAAVAGGLRSALTAPLLAALLAIAGVAAVGWMDDHRPLPVLPRLATHGAAGLVVAWLAAASHPVAATAAAVAWFVWWVFWSVSVINIVNFMDGIDGLIGSQVALFAASVALRAAPGSFSMLFALSLAGAAAGFLLWNWAPARIFLGDVGSGALGLAVVVAGLLLIVQGRGGVLLAYLPLLPLFLDASVTIARRAWRGERLTAPHRSHLYQRLANGGWGHARVSAAYLAAASVGVAVVLGPEQWQLPLAATYALAVLAVGAWLDRAVKLRTSGLPSVVDPAGHPTRAAGLRSDLPAAREVASNSVRRNGATRP